MNEQIDYNEIVNDIHKGRYQVKSIKSAEPNAIIILTDYISNIPDEIDAVVEHAKNQGYTFSELVALVAKSGVKKGLSLN